MNTFSFKGTLRQMYCAFLSAVHRQVNSLIFQLKLQAAGQCGGTCGATLICKNRNKPHWGNIEITAAVASTVWFTHNVGQFFLLIHLQMYLSG